ncbi:MAG: 16S rRNA (guanine(527)-N(7))-methyltransferase RsmG [Lautropia sp.]|nr:16S rRNA (guanine(527)-N(7))-methyltransferase RsmG [Lautropia sp.]
MSQLRRTASSQRQNTQWRSTDSERLEAGLNTLGLHLEARQLARLNQWAALLLQWNHTYNLLGNSDTRVLIDEHLLDSLAIVPSVERHLPDPQAPLADIGSGAGFPGILLAIMHPERPIALVEPVGKKAAFLRQSALTLGLKCVNIHAQRLEALNQLDVGGDDPNFICRAFTALGRYAALCSPFMSERSLAFAMKSAKLPEEQRELPAEITLDAIETLPTAMPNTQRFLAVLRKHTGHSPVHAQPMNAEPTDRRRLA